MLAPALTVLAGYVIGAVPVAYLTGRLLKGVDIRRQGSGNVGASNVWQSVSRAAVVPVGVLEIGQGLAGIAIAKAADQPLGVQVGAGLAAIAGHNWSPFLLLSGGRGIGHALGFMLLLSWPGLGAFTGVSLAGVALGAIPQAVGLGIVAAPLAALAKGQAVEIVAGLSGVAALVFAKRLLGNRPIAPTDAAARAVLRNRLLYDRDVREREAWVQGER
jgi:glycerol-3-phosphate acyltransferase PlsY